MASFGRAALVVLGLFYATLLPAAAQPIQAQVVTSCGTPPSTYSAGTPRPILVDVNGNLCGSSTGAVTGTVTANQGTAAASDSWLVNLNKIAGAALSLGQKVMATSIPVVLPSDQAAIPVTVSAGTAIIGGVGASKHLVSSTLTKISGGGTYTGATSTAPQAICLAASVTICAPLTMTVSSTATVTGNITGIMLEKSTTGATAATFRVFVYQAAPTLTGVFNTSVYLALAADITSGAYVGSWECSSQVVNTDNSYYDCAANRPSGNNAFNLTDGTLRFVVVATGAYVSGSSETFNVMADVLTSVP